MPPRGPSRRRTRRLSLGSGTQARPTRPRGVLLSSVAGASGPPSPIGRRVHVIGNSASGKSSLAKRLASALQADFVDLDALNWLPDWYGLNENDPDELIRRFADATRGDAWVAAGSYRHFAQRTFWSRLDTVVWLDLPMPLLLWRVLRRSWRRWRTKELLWGTNVERFWPQLALWRKSDSLVYWIISAHRRKRETMLADMVDPRWGHIRFVRLTTVREVDEFASAVEGPALDDSSRPPRKRDKGDIPELL